MTNMIRMMKITMTKFTFVFLMAIIAICLIYCVVMCAVLVHHYCKLNAEYKKVKKELKSIEEGFKNDKN